MLESFKRLMSDLLDGFLSLLKDFFVWCYEKSCDLLIFIFESLSIPANVMNVQIADHIHPDIAYFLMLSGFDRCLVLLGSALLFRITRKIVTLGKW